MNNRGQLADRTAAKQKDWGPGKDFFGGWNVSFQGNTLKSYALDNVVTLISNLVVCDLGEA